MNTCSVKNCTRKADYRVILYDVYLYPGQEEVFFETDSTCPFICTAHMAENERQAKGERRPRGDTLYPYTNNNGAQGFTIYQPLDA
jgi:hypothetical protein